MKSDLRISAPIMIVLVAVLIYAARDTVLTPIVDGSPRAQSAGVQAPADVDPLGQSEAGDDAVLAGAIDEVETPPEPVREEAFVPLIPVDTREGKIRKNSSLYEEMRNMGFTPVEIDRVARAAKSTYNLKRVQPGQRFTAFTTNEGRLDSLVFYVSLDYCLKVRRHGEEFVAAMDTIPYETTYHVTTGTIHSSIFAALQEQDAETELAAALDDIFGWTIDFISDIRKGDSFTILYERRTYPDGRSSLGNVLSARIVNQGNELHAFRYQTEGENASYYDLEGNSLQKSLRRSPLKFTRVTSNFSGRRYHPVYKRSMPHYGVDYGAPRGTPIYATGDGIIERSRYRRGNGNYVRIKHNNVYTTYYLHMNGFAKGVKEGRRVKQGQIIGYVGSTGSATGSHVCYRVKRYGKWVNPRKLRLPSKEPVPDTEITRYEHVRDSYLYRIQGALAEGTKDRTIAVERPVYPGTDQRATLF
jgi:murein DD-endopeptidase MepM/ murein hydrolase activator NlpD